MVHILYLIFMAMINSVDNMGIGIAYSIAGKKVPIIKNLLISFMAFAVSFVSSLSGDIASRFLTEQTSTVLSMFLLAVMGAKMIYHSITEKDTDDLEKFNIISNKEAIATGTILALDDVGSSVSSGMIGYGPLMVSIPFFVVSFIIFFLSNYGTKFMSKLNIGKKAGIISGLLMIFMGLLQFIA